MKAAVWKALNDLRVEDVPEPNLRKSDQIKVKIAFCGICGSDLHTVAGRLAFAPKPPALIGHEATGTIIEVGSDVSRYKPGQRVALNFMGYCQSCYYCRNGMEHLCEKPFWSARSFAEYAIFPERSAYLLPDDITFEEGTFTEPVSTCLHGIDLANIYPGSTVAILGAGPIGLLLLQLAIRAGASKTLVSEPEATRRKVAKQLGADVVVDPLNENLESISKQLTDSRGFDTVIETSGNLQVAKQAVFLADNCGTILWFATYLADSEIGIAPYYLYSKELTIRHIKMSPYTFPRAVSLLSKLQLKSLISDIIHLDEINKGFDLCRAGKAIKVLVKP